ncbi:MAG: undecaprenyl-phosphate galactose phosphotransferase WbaP [Proteobacteria bacterium]|nr:undecaprenyl-phosphate galactose phosphotransferase WbaP [Pseudomonadota bacterium]
MTQTPLKNKAAQDLNLPSDLEMDDLVERIATLAKEVRSVPAFENIRLLQNSSHILQSSGRCLLLSDIIGVFAAFLCGGLGAWALNVYAFHDSFQKLFSSYSLQQSIIFGGLGLIALLWLEAKGHYRQRLPYWETVGHILTVTAIGLMVGGFIQFAAKNFFSRLWLGLSWGLFAVFLFIGRKLVRQWLEHHGQWQIPALIIGKGPTAQSALNALTQERRMGFRIVGQISSETLTDLTKPRAWKRLMMAHGAAHLFLALEGSELERQQAALKAMGRDGLAYSIIPPWLGLPSSTLSPHHFMMQDALLLHDTNRLLLPIPRLIKRSFDLFCAGAGLVVLSPVFLTVALMIRRDGGPAFYRQPRVGRNSRVFSCYKFRSMRVDADQTLRRHLDDNPEAAAEWQKFQKLKKDPRITPFGDFIRRTSIDELPQLINVVKGEMSLVGPRPIMQGQEIFYEDDFTYYESVRPGITGPWQVSGRNRLTFKERVALEAWYARNWSPWLDIVILMKTIPALMEKGQAF